MRVTTNKQQQQKQQQQQQKKALDLVTVNFVAPSQAIMYVPITSKWKNCLLMDCWQSCTLIENNQNDKECITLSNV